MRVISFVVTGDPVGKGRPRLGRNHTYTPPKTAKYEDYVRLSYNLQVSDKRPLEGNINANIVAYFKPAKSASKTEKMLMYYGKRRPTKKPDIDNITKIIFDALNKVAYTDDSQIVFLQASKKYITNEDEPARVIVTLSGD